MNVSSPLNLFFRRMALFSFVPLLLALCSAVLASHVWAQTPSKASGPAIGSQSAAKPSQPVPADDLPGIRMQIRELKRTANSVTLRFTLFNDRNAPFAIGYNFGGWGNIQNVRVVDAATNKSYSVMFANGCQCSENVRDIAPKSQVELYAKFAVGPEVQQVTVTVPHFTPMEDLAIGPAGGTNPLGPVDGAKPLGPAGGANPLGPVDGSRAVGSIGGVPAPVEAGDLPGVRMQIKELRRTGSSVTLRLLLFNDASAPFAIGYNFGGWGNIQNVRVVDAAANKSYSVMFANGCQCSENVRDIASKSQVELYAKFVVGPEVQRVTVMVPHFTPMEDLAIGPAGGANPTGSAAAAGGKLVRGPASAGSSPGSGNSGSSGNANPGSGSSGSSQSGGAATGPVYSAASMAALLVSSTVVNSCNSQYVATNSLLDVIVGGCSALSVRPAQPDTFVRNVPRAGTGSPYKLFADNHSTVRSCTDQGGSTVDLGTCLQAAAYSGSGLPSQRVYLQLFQPSPVPSGSNSSSGSSSSGSSGNVNPGSGSSQSGSATTVDLFNNLSSPSAVANPVSNSFLDLSGNAQPLAASFSTGASAFNFNSLTVALWGAGPTTAIVFLLSDASNSPGAVLGGLSASMNLQPTASNITIGTPGNPFPSFTLAPNTRYWIELSISTPANWSFTIDTSGTGVAGEFSAYKPYPGTSWVVLPNTVGPLQMEVAGTKAAGTK